jgi:dihydroorotate dehydrogenase
MPDWTYQTVFRPALFRLGAETGRRLALGSMGLLARLPLGRRMIQMMGHMKPDPRLAIERNGLSFPAAVGLGCAVDPYMSATSALAEFGFGFLEIGPIATHHEARAGSIHLQTDTESIQFDEPRAAITPTNARDRLIKNGLFRLPTLARIAPSSPDDARQILDLLGRLVEGFVVPIDCLDNVCQAYDVNDDAILFVAIDAGASQDEAKKERCSQAVRERGVRGIIVASAAEEHRAQRIGKPDRDEALETVQQLRKELGPELIIIGSVGVHSPADALDYVEAGADMVQVDSGLVFAGPGLPKRINEALLYRRLMTQPESEPTPTRVGNESWFWAMLMGLGVFVGGVLAMIVATTRVVLPYDEVMSGLTRAQLIEINDRLLLFMTHDRVTLAGTMLAVGIMYVTMAWWGIRRGVHWAYLSVVASALAGFLSFFSFLGFGHFDPFHAFVTAILCQFLLLTIHARLPERHQMEMPDLHNDRRWRANQWGQLLFVIHGAVLIVAGSVISYIGMTTVFVPEDLEFMHTSAADLYGTHPQLVPLVAHDRATFGGMLIACGVATLLPALWGFRRGQAWLWWSLMLAGNVAYLSTMLVHWNVGYHSLKHLIPAYSGLGCLWAGGLASYWFLAAHDERLEQEWKRRLSVSAR